MKQLRTPMFTVLDGSLVVLYQNYWYADTHKLFLAFGEHGMYCPVVFD